MNTARFIAIASFTALSLSSCKQKEPSATVINEAKDDSIQITINPTTTRAINGVSDVNRNAYFALCDEGVNLEGMVKTPERFEHLTKDLGVKMGRMLGPVRKEVDWPGTVVEDPNRPGYANIETLKAKLAPNVKEPSAAMKAYFGDNLDVAAHGNHNAFPHFMGEYLTEEIKKETKADHKEHIPQNIDAAAELTAAVVEYGFNDFTRPAFVEPLNEPHWSYYGNQHLADWHLITKEKIQQRTPKVKVGGLCMAVPYLYNDHYRIWKGMKDFIDNTQGKLDFYSFHAYDYYEQEEAGKNETRISSGLPLEGVLDLINNYTTNTLGREVPLVISEHGGYTLNRDNSPQAFDGESLAKRLYDTHVKEKKEGFAGEQERRSIVAWMHLSTIITNTMTFMDHPHSLQKAVPFILTNTMNWDPKYYAAIYVPKDYDKNSSEWTESFLLNFYKFFRGVDGRRVAVESGDPDLQVRSFVNDQVVYTVVNNLSLKEHKITLNGLDGATHEIRRVGRAENYLPFYTEAPLDSTTGITVKSREAMVVVSTFKNKVTEKKIAREKIFYGDKITLVTNKQNPQASITVKVPDPAKVSSATLRLSINRMKGCDHNVNITLNGKALEVPMEDCADRLDDVRTGYASTKIITLPQGILAAENKIDVTFPDGKDGSVGTAVIRASY